MERIKTFEAYSKLSQAFRDCPKTVQYSVEGLTEEAGEVAGKLKKYWRDKVYLFPERYELNNPPEDVKDGILKELGDVLWYVNDMALLLGYSLEEVANMNIEKLYGRVKRGTIHGQGDDR